MDGCVEMSIVFYDLPESKNDINYVRRLLEDEMNSVAEVHRFGKTPSASLCSFNQPGSQTACHPLKVELASSKNRNWVLRNAKMLARAYYVLQKFLSTSELEYVKITS